MGGFGLVVLGLAAVRYVTSGAIEIAPLLVLPVVGTGWRVGRRAAIAIALVASAAWIAPLRPFQQPLSGWSVLNAIALTATLAAIGWVSAVARSRFDVAVQTDAKRREALGLLAAQLRESVVSIDVAVPLLADPMTLDRTQGAAFDQVRRHARGLTHLANDLLTLDQVDTRKMLLTMVPVDLAAFVLEITDQRVPRDRITIVAPAVPVQVNADPERLRQLLDHLLQNALKFSPPGAGLMVSISTTADEARVSVRDHGVGLSAEDMGVLFTRYGRIRDSRTANVSGMGLGLYVAKLVAEAHGGDLTAASAGRGLGATFTLVLPLAGAQRRPRAPRPLPASSFWD